MARLRISDYDHWARAHHGLLTRASPGISDDQWYRGLKAGSFEQVHPGVARLPGTPNTPEQRIAAAVLAVDNGVASHRSAARLWGIPRPDDDPVDVIATRTAGPPALDGVDVHRPTDRARLGPIKRYGIACTNPLRTIVDLGAVDPDGVDAAVGHLVSTGVASLDTLTNVVQQHSRKGRSGIGPLRRSIEAWSIDGQPADSLLEAAFRRLVRRYDLPELEFHPTIEGVEVDFRVVDTPVIIECDGWLHHGVDRDGFERDRERDALLSAAGWIVLRFTYRWITQRPAATAARIRAAIEQWQPAADPASDNPPAA